MNSQHLLRCVALRTHFDSAYRSRISHVSTLRRRRIKWALRSIHSLIVLCVHCRSGKGAIKSKLMTFYMSNKGKHFTQFGLCVLSSYFVVDLYFYVVSASAVAQSSLCTTASFSEGRQRKKNLEKRINSKRTRCTYFKWANRLVYIIYFYVLCANIMTHFGGSLPIHKKRNSTASASNNLWSSYYWGFMATFSYFVYKQALTQCTNWPRF